MLHTIKDAIAFTEENGDLAIYSRGTGFSNADKMKNRDEFRKKLA